MSKLAPVESALQEAGCTKWTKFGEDDGTPPGWILIGDTDHIGRPRGIVPTSTVPMEERPDILNVLRPLPEINISLEGGVPLGYSSWLAGFPPAIRIIGDVQHAQKVLIDGKEATIRDGGICCAPGWDEPGPHQVWCSNKSRGYSLIRLERTWDAWPAYTFRLPSSGGVAICGPLVRPLATDGTFGKSAGTLEAEDVLRSNPLLLGAGPGEVFWAAPRRDVRGAYYFASPPFDPVWALPAEPLLCDKTAHHIVLVGDARAPINKVASAGGNRDLAVVPDNTRREQEGAIGRTCGGCRSLA
jgi:hypothetical protein